MVVIVTKSEEKGIEDLILLEYRLSQNEDCSQNPEEYQHLSHRQRKKDQE